MNKISVKELSIDEKIKLVVAKNFREVNDLNGKLPRVKVSDGPVGLRSAFNKDGIEEKSDLVSIAYPSIQVLSQTWDIDLAKKYGETLADDWIDRNIDILLGPGTNIKRNPLCGRNFEYFSEDPFLAGKFAKAYICGVKEKHIGTSLKHYCCNNHEYSRHWISSEVDERTLREIYLKPFEIAIEAQPETIMCAYNLVNGVRMSENKYLYDIAKNDFRFKGLIISDWDAVKDATASINAGMSLIFPFREEHIVNLTKGYEDGRLDLKKLDEACENILAFVYSNYENSKLRKSKTTLEERSNFAQKVAEEGIVLVKNNGVLPLKKENKILVTGEPSFRYYYGGGSSNVPIGDKFLPLDKAIKSVGYDATFFESVWENCGSTCHLGNIKACFKEAISKDVIIITVGQNHNYVFESTDRKDLELTKEEIDVIYDLSKLNKKMILCVYAGSPIDLTMIENLFDAILLVGYSGERVSQALANILVGKVNPSGRLTETYALRLEDYPSEHTYKDEACVVYSEGLNVGYRYFSTMGVPTLYPFGYGLSYSKFIYNDFNIYFENDEVKISFKVTNDSDIDGKEVIQIYVGELTKCVYRPVKELKAFKKVFIKAHDTVEVTLSLKHDAFAYYSINHHAWIVNKGFFNIEVAENCEEVLYNEIVEVK